MSHQYFFLNNKFIFILLFGLRSSFSAKRSFIVYIFFRVKTRRQVGYLCRNKEKILFSNGIKFDNKKCCFYGMLQYLSLIAILPRDQIHALWLSFIDPSPSEIKTSLHNRQPNLWLQDICLKVLKVNGNELCLFGTKAFSLFWLIGPRIKTITFLMPSIYATSMCHWRGLSLKINVNQSFL